MKALIRKFIENNQGSAPYYYRGRHAGWVFSSKLDKTDRKVLEGVVSTEAGRKRLIATVKAEAERFEKAKAKAALALKAKRHGLRSVKEAEGLTKKASDILGYYRSGYSMGDIKELYVDDVLFYTLDDRQEYAKSSKWRAMHGRVETRLTKSELRKAEAKNGTWQVETPKGVKSLKTEGKYENIKIAWS